MLEPLRIRDFALLWTGMSVSLIGDGILLVALGWQTYALSGSPSTLGWIVAAYGLIHLGRKVHLAAGEIQTVGSTQRAQIEAW